MILEAFGYEFELVNEDKAERTINGTIGRNASMVGGVGQDASPEAKIAEYDRLGGLIKYSGDTVKKGSFYDFKAKKPIAEPVIKLQFNINGKVVEVDASEPLPPLVRAAKEAEQGVVAETEGDDEKPQGKKGNLIGGGKKAAKPKKAEESDEEAE